MKVTFFLLFGLFFGNLSMAQTISVKITETDPLENETLKTGKSLYLHIIYDSNIQLRFQAKAFYNGINQKAAMNPAPLYPTGKGEAIAWIFFFEPNQIDEIRIDVFNTNWEKIKSIPFKINMKWISASSKNKRTKADWAQKLNSEQQNMVGYDQKSQAYEGYWTDRILMIIGLIIPGYFVLQIYMGAAYKKGWLKAALIPLILLVPIIIYSLFALFQGSNLCPLFLIFAAPFGFFYLSGLGIFKFIKERKESALPKGKKLETWNAD